MNLPLRPAPRAGRRQRRRSAGQRARMRFVAIWLSPIMALFALVWFVPIGMAAWLSLHRYSPLSAVSPFIGLRNYVFAFTEDPLFVNALGNTVKFTVVAVPLNVAISLPVAMGLNALKRGGTVFRVLFFAPVTASLVAAALVWVPIYDPQAGWLNAVTGWLGLPQIAWLQNPGTSLWAVLAAALWQDLPYNIIIFLAGLQSIPPLFYDAAKVDGATRFQRFRHITIPLLRRTFVFVFVLSMISYMQQFTHVQVLTRGGPLHSSETLLPYIFARGFNDFQMGYASAMAMVLFAIMLVITVTQLRLMRQRWEY